MTAATTTTTATTAPAATATAADTMVHRLFAQARRHADLPAYHVKVGTSWRSTPWRDFAAEVRRAARALMALGVQPRGTVSLLGFNRPEWVILSVASMAAGAAGAGIYTTSSPAEVRYIVGHAESRVVLVEDAAQLAKVREVWGELPALAHVVTMKGAPASDDPRVLSWEAFMARGDEVSDERLDERVAALEPNGLAVLIYTSGTTGPPKGVMLSHENLSWTATTAQRLTAIGPQDCSLSYLPLSHIAEQMFTIHGPITSGASVYFAESIEKVPDNLKEVQPTVFFGVPRIWEKFHAGITARMRAATGVKKRLAEWAMGVARRVNALRMRGAEPTGSLALEYRLATRLVFSKLKPAIGLGRARICVSGAAPIARDVLEFFTGLDIVVLEVYGQSEDTGPTSFNRPGKVKLGTVGPALPGVEVKIADDGEILVRGPNVFLGYYKEPAATAETLKDGWLCSGDLGSFDADGFLSITGRKKEIIITAGGKNITPKNIEEAIKRSALVSEAVVIGDRRKFLTALVTLDAEAAAAFLAQKGAATDAPHDSPDVRAAVQEVVDAANRELARVETVKKFTILPRPFSVESGELTPTLKVKRRVVADHFAEQIEAMYRE